jgi:RNA polymerase sigma-70 factor (ECF subfamily)
LLTPDLILSASRGDTRAFRTLVETHQGRVYSLAFRFVRNAPDAEDITQEVFVRLWKNISQYNPQQARFSTWLYRIASNCCLDFIKASPGKINRNLVDIGKVADVASSLTPEQELNGKELNDLVTKAADELAPKQRLVFILRDLEGLSPDEVAQALNMTPGNVKSNLCHARQKIAAKLRFHFQLTDNPSFNE